MVKKYESFRSDGGHSSFLGLNTYDKIFYPDVAQKYRGYEAYFQVSSYPSAEEARMALLALKDSWKKSVDAELDGAKLEEKLKKIDKKDIQEAESGTEIPKGEVQKILDDIKELQDNVKKTEPEKVEDMKKLMERVEKENREQVEKLNEKIDELQEDKQSIAGKLQQAINNNNTAQAAILTKQLEAVQNSIDDKLLEKTEVISKEKIEELLKARNKSWFQVIDWKNPWTYAKISLALVILFVIIGLFIWLWGKIKSLLANK